MQQIDHTKNIIEVKNVSFSYNAEEVLKDISLNVHKGDYLGVIGPNGGGKSTLLRVILGLLTPSKGTVKLFEQNIDKFQDWSKIGFVPQKATQFDTSFPLTVFEVVAMGRYAKRGLFRLLAAEDKELIRKSLQQVEMYEYRNRLIGDLSSGQQQRVFIARSLAGQPEVIVLDEPTVGVDVKVQEQFYSLLQKLNTDLNLTLILVSHELDVVANQATELACINHTLVYHGTPKGFFDGDHFAQLYGKGVKFVLHN